jgi:homoserine kinase type II
MAVYTRIGAEAMAVLIDHFGVGTLTSAKGIAEGVSNSNWLIETSAADGVARRFILTMFEGRTEVAELPFFLGLLDHLAEAGCPVPRTIHDRAGAPFRMHDGKAVALIEFLPGVSVSQPDAGQAHAVGMALAQVHRAATTFARSRDNTMGPAAWADLLGQCGDAGLAAIDPMLPALVSAHLPRVTGAWPADLPRGVIHADLFPDNVLMLGNDVTGMIDFYFACHDTIAYDLAVTHAAWCFEEDGGHFLPDISAALLAGYRAVRPLSVRETAAMPLLAQGAALRFLATRAYDWLNTPADALVTRKDPLAFARRLAFYAAPGNAALFLN